VRLTTKKTARAVPAVHQVGHLIGQHLITDLAGLPEGELLGGSLHRLGKRGNGGSGLGSHAVGPL